MKPTDPHRNPQTPELEIKDPRPDHTPMFITGGAIAMALLAGLVSAGTLDLTVATPAHAPAAVISERASHASFGEEARSRIGHMEQTIDELQDQPDYHLYRARLAVLEDDLDSLSDQVENMEAAEPGRRGLMGARVESRLESLEDKLEELSARLS